MAFLGRHYKLYVLGAFVLLSLLWIGVTLLRLQTINDRLSKYSAYDDYLLFDENSKQLKQNGINLKFKESKYAHIRVDSTKELLLAADTDFISFNGPQRTSTSKTIPHIIHQTWDTQYVPQYFKAFIQSWVDKHPQWEYWFWTQADINMFVAKEYPEYIDLFESYISPIFRADAMRYFVLYKYGGVYADLDMKALRPIDDWTFGYQCLFTQECYEHTFIVREDDSANLLNGFIAVRPNHPFIYELIKALPEFAGRFFGDYLYATGPLFVDAVYRRYISNSTNSHTAAGKVTIVPPKYFVPTFDPGQSEVISGKCFPLNIKKLKPKSQKVCQMVLGRFFQNKPLSESYTDHGWIHAYMLKDQWKKENIFNVYSIISTIMKNVSAII